MTLRTIILKYLLFLSKNNAGIFEEEGVNMLLKLLKNEPDECQSSIFFQNKKEENKNNNIKEQKPRESKKNNLVNPIGNQANPIKSNQGEEIYYMSKSCFNNILSSIFSQYNPTSLELSDEYYHACHIIKVFKYLCEAQNQYFQRLIINEITFPIGPFAKLSFYDMMLFILDKIIVISSWEQAKGEDEVQDYFYGLFSCIIELIIESVRGSDTSNFNNFLKEEKEEVNLPLIQDEQNKMILAHIDSIREQNKIDNNNITNNESKQFEGRRTKRERTIQSKRGVRRNSIRKTRNGNYVYEKGKALKIFLINIKKIMFDNTAESEIIFNVRKDLMNFLLSFMEEPNCPRKIKNLIMSCYHPNIVIK